MRSQWDCLLQNLGTWQGSFTRLTPTGIEIEDIPSLVSLEGLENNTLVRQTVRTSPSHQPPSEKVFEYRSLNRATLCFETGAFSQGSMQWSPLAEFGGELGLKAGDRRLRLVVTYDKSATLDRLTLIREALAGRESDTHPLLTVEQLLGTWQGQAVTLFPDLRSPEFFSTRLELMLQDSQILHQTLSFGDYRLSSHAKIEGSRLLFTESELSVQVLLLPNGGSLNCPQKILPRQSFVLEAGWLIDPTHRQRLVRRYDKNGAWSSLTLVQEEKVIST
jgi:hypothetical protein